MSEKRKYTHPKHWTVVNDKLVLHPGSESESDEEVQETHQDNYYIERNVIDHILVNVGESYMTKYRRTLRRKRQWTNK